MAENLVQSTKINLITGINLDPVSENTWGFDQDHQHIQNTGFVFDDGIANINEKESAAPVAGSQYVTADGDTVSISTPRLNSLSSYCRDVYINGSYIDTVSGYGVESSGTFTACDAVIDDTGAVMTLDVKNSTSGYIQLIVKTYSSGVLTNSKTITTTLAPVTAIASFGIVRQTHGRNIFNFGKSTMRYYAFQANSTMVIIKEDGTLDFSGSIDLPSTAVQKPLGYSSFTPSLQVVQFYNTNDYIATCQTQYNSKASILFQKSGSGITTSSTSYGNYALHQSYNGYNRVALTGPMIPSTATAPCCYVGYGSFTASYSFTTLNQSFSTSTFTFDTPFYNFKAMVDNSSNLRYTNSGDGLLAPGLTQATSKASKNMGIRNVHINGQVQQKFVFSMSFIGGGTSFSGSSSPVPSLTPLTISVSEYINNDVMLGVPISQVGSYDLSFAPQLSPTEDAILWLETDATFKYVKIGTAIGVLSSGPPVVQKITNNLYKINSIDPINIIDKSTNKLELGSNDYCGGYIEGSATAESYSATGSFLIQSKYANSIDYGDQVIYSYINPSSPSWAKGGGIGESSLYLPRARVSSVNHLGYNYFFVTQYMNTRPTGVSAGIATADCYGAFTGYTDMDKQAYLNQISEYPVHTRNVTVPIPLTTFYSGKSLPGNSVAYSDIYKKTFVTSGFRGTALTSEYDGYLIGNEYWFSSKAFTIFSQGYVFDGKTIYAVTFSGNYIQTPPQKVIDATGLRFIGSSPIMALFYSDMDRSMWAFDGGRTMQKIKKIDGYPQLVQALYNSRDDAIVLDTGAGFIWYREGLPTYQARKSNQVGSVRLYDTDDGLIIGNDSYNWHYSYTTEYGSTVFPFTLQTGFIGPTTNQRMILQAVTFGIMNEDKTKITFNAKMIGIDNDKYYDMVDKTFVVNPTDYVGSGVYRVRLQDLNPQRVLAASFKLTSSSKIRIFELQYHWREDVQAIYSGARSK